MNRAQRRQIERDMGIRRSARKAGRRSRVRSPQDDILAIAQRAQDAGLVIGRPQLLGPDGESLR